MLIFVRSLGLNLSIKDSESLSFLLFSELCFKLHLNIFFQGEYYNADEVQAMVAAEMLEEKRKKKEEEAMFDDIGEIGKKKRKGPMIAD